MEKGKLTYIELIDNISEVKLIDKKLLYNFEYRDSKKYFLYTRKAGYYSLYPSLDGNKSFTKEDIENYYKINFITDPETLDLYLKPYVKIILKNGHEYTKEFNTIEEAEEYQQSLLVYIKKPRKI